MALIGFTWIRSDFCGSTRVLRVVLGVPPKTGFKGIPSPVKLTLTQSALKPTLPAVRRSARPARTPLRAASCNERVQICCVAWSFNQQRATFNPSPPRGYVKEPPAKSAADLQPADLPERQSGSDASQARTWAPGWCLCQRTTCKSTITNCVILVNK